jgi:DNA-binding NarL/FixJ family response regulator
LVLAEAAQRGPATPSPMPGPTAEFAQLSVREREVLTVLAEGVTNNELGERLFISERTANRHLSNIFTKLGVPSRAAATAWAYEHRLV